MAPTRSRRLLCRHATSTSSTCGGSYLQGGGRQSDRRVACPTIRHTRLQKGKPFSAKMNIYYYYFVYLTIALHYYIGDKALVHHAILSGIIDEEESTASNDDTAEWRQEAEQESEYIVLFVAMHLTFLFTFV